MSLVSRCVPRRAGGSPLAQIPRVSRLALCSTWSRGCVGDTQARRKTPGLWAATAGASPVRQLASRHWESEALDAEGESNSRSALRCPERERRGALAANASDALASLEYARTEPGRVRHDGAAPTPFVTTHRASGPCTRSVRQRPTKRVVPVRGLSANLKPRPASCFLPGRELRVSGRSRAGNRERPFA